ncbi:putative glutamine amidotransferase DUG3 [Smittium culicis]|uniref:Putative glutamine amidotransferase DUG3 n=1 Tax=Smittium culicis TaxID=133412 RepID=A0A1R1YEE0_9FUNG|nr:putative glutamine amidotransferase DUG3 [Smittium culicis]
MASLSFAQDIFQVRSNKKDKSFVIASEPLTFERNDWIAIPTNTLLVITPKLNILMYPIKDQHFSTEKRTTATYL